MSTRARLWLLSLVFCAFGGRALANSQRIAGIAFDKDDHVYVWSRDGVVTTGTPRHFEEYSHARKVKIPPGETMGRIVAMAISGDNRVHAWYRDGKTSTGTATDLGKFEAPRAFTLPAGRTASNIVGIGFTTADQVVAWYNDLTFSVGTATKLADLHGPAPYVLPPGKTASSIVEIDIAKSNERTHAWYTDGFGSTGNVVSPGSHQQSFGYVPAEVLYQWWGPAPPGSHLSHPFAGSSGIPAHPAAAAAGSDDDDLPSWIARKARRGRDDGPPSPPMPQPDPGGDPSEEEGNPFSPAFASSFLPGFSAPDFHVAVGQKYVIVSNTGKIEFFDKAGQQLPNTTGMQTKLSTAEFFQGFVSKTNADGRVNESNINLYMRLPKPCDSPDYPELRSGNRFCIGSFYDTRVFYDSTSSRFFILSNSRYDVWNEDCVEGGPKCSCYVMNLSSVADPSICTENDGKNCSVSTDEYCGLARRYPVFAVSKTDDPRDGFHQYILTRNIPRDWPAMSVNGGHFVVAAQGKLKDDEVPVATVFFLNAIKSGVRHPPFFRYFSKDVGGASRALPVTQYESKAGRTFLLTAHDSSVDIFAFGQQIDPWTAPPLQKASVDLGASMPKLFGSVYRKDRLYMVGTTEAESTGTGDNQIFRCNIHLFRIPVVPISGTAIQASKDPAKGYLESHFGKRSIADPPNVKYSYVFPTISVNRDGHMLIGYMRRPYQSPTPLQPEARYSVWYAGEEKIRSSWLLQAGEGADPGGGIDYASAVVDPDEKTFWVGLAYVNSQMAFRMVVGRIVP